MRICPCLDLEFMLMNMSRRILLSWLLLVAVGALAEDLAPAPPLGDVARQARAMANKKTAKVFTNDDLKAVDFNNGAVSGDKAAEEAAKADAANKSKSATAADLKKRDDEFRSRYLDQKKSVDFLQRELSVLQREYQLQTTEFYRDAATKLSDPKAWTEKRTKYEADIAEKQLQVDRAKKTLDDIKEEARKAGASPQVFEETDQSPK